MTKIIALITQVLVLACYKQVAKTIFIMNKFVITKIFMTNYLRKSIFERFIKNRFANLQYMKEDPEKHYLSFCFIFVYNKYIRCIFFDYENLQIIVRQNN